MITLSIFVVTFLVIYAVEVSLAWAEVSRKLAALEVANDAMSDQIYELEAELGKVRD